MAPSVAVAAFSEAECTFAVEAAGKLQRLLDSWGRPGDLYTALHGSMTSDEMRRLRTTAAAVIDDDLHHEQLPMSADDAALYTLLLADASSLPAEVGVRTWSGYFFRAAEI